MMILKILQEGKISADEAAKLLESLESGSKKDKKNRLKNQARVKANSSGYLLLILRQKNRARISACR